MMASTAPAIPFPPKPIFYTARLEPSLAEACWRRGRFRLLAGQPAEAVGDFEQAIELNPGLEDYLRPLLDQARQGFHEIRAEAATAPARKEEV